MKEYVFKQEDVGKRSMSAISDSIDVKCKCCGHIKKEYPFEPLGEVQQIDVGKICKKIKGIWYVENQEQFYARRNREAAIKKQS